jgi:SAM-dependent methyltransferase
MSCDLNKALKSCISPKIKPQASLNTMLSDPWLERWLALICERSANSPVLEMGCGRGEDTLTLLAAKLSIHAFDLSPEAVDIAKLRAPSAIIECRDIREPLPERPEGFAVIVASLSLHYFPWSETEAIVERIRLALSPGGILLCRLNSTEDHNFGASGYPEIEPNFYLVDGEAKRFFNQSHVESLFAVAWEIRSLEHVVTTKYIKEKAVWELVVERCSGRDY